ncbi:alpha/beta hydrolase [Belliella sp. DSM 111904]|uniref:Alpha/beta hydrolase n=1 Tax=Belliella filtrata TaxID=2923435 RepID=A0ABS9UWQ4_9BACT|nr:alpha/beta hydrolase [Belliella filtrata]MCH7408233.1 alpha/beta hydrolase [Belliella filtrata]
MDNKTKRRKFRFAQMGEGPDILLLGGSVADWGDVLERLSKSFSVHIPLFSYDVVREQSDSDLVHYLELIVEELMLNEFSIIAHSVSAFTAIQFAKQHEQKVKNLIILSFPNLNRDKEALIGKLYDKLTRSNLKKSGLVMRRVFWEVLIKNQISLLNPRQSDIELAAVTLFVFGEHDVLASRESLGVFNKQFLEKSKVIVFNNCGHLLMKDNPLYLSLVIKKFILENNDQQIFSLNHTKKI